MGRATKRNLNGTIPPERVAEACRKARVNRRAPAEPLRDGCVQAGQQTGNKHNAGNDRQRTAVAPRGFANARYQQRPEYTCKTPGRKHEAIDRANPFRSEEIGCKCRHCAKAAAITTQYDETESDEYREFPLRGIRKNSPAWTRNMIKK